MLIDLTKKCQRSHSLILLYSDSTTKGTDSHHFPRQATETESQTEKGKQGNLTNKGTVVIS